MSGMAWRQVRAGLLGMALLAFAAPLMTGCAGFFVCQGKASCGTSTTTTTGSDSDVDYAFVSNSSSSATSLAVYGLSTGSPVSAGTVSLGYVPNAMVVTPDNSTLFVSAPASSAIYAYTIGSTGTLTNPNGSSPVANLSALPNGMDVSPDGKYLFVLTGSTLAYALQEYQIGSNGTLSAVSSVVLTPSTTVTGYTVKVAPSDEFVAVALGTAGDVTVPLSNGLFANANANYLGLSSSTVGDYGITVDSNNYVYVARTGQVAVYVANSSGGLTQVNNSAGATGAGDHSIAANGSYVYTANATANTVSGFAVSSGVLTGLSAVNAPSSAAAIGFDRTGKYVVVAGYGSGGLVEYTIGSGGALTAASSTGTLGSASAGTVVMALTH